MTRNDTTKAPRSRSPKDQPQTGAGNPGPRRGRRSSGAGAGRAGQPSSTAALIRQIIEGVAVPELLRRHGSLPPTRRSRAGASRTASLDMAQLVRLLKRTDRSAARDYVDMSIRTANITIETLMLDIFPRAADLLEAEVAAGRSPSAISVVALSNLRMLALAQLEIAAVGHSIRPHSGRVALLSMVEDAASFDLVPYEYALWADNYEVANLEGVSPKTLMDVLHSKAFDCVMVGCRRPALAPSLSRWLRAARVVARGRPKFVSIAHPQSGQRDALSGCTASVYGARDAVTFMSEIMLTRTHLPEVAETAFQMSDLTHYRSTCNAASEMRRRPRAVSDACARQSRVLTRQ